MKTASELGKDILDILQAPGAGRPFLAGIDRRRAGRRDTLTVHAAAASMSSGQSRELSARLKRANGALRVRVKRHPARTLETARSLQAFLKPFDHQRIVFDPTGVFDRGARLVELVKSARRACGFGMRKCLWHSPTGTLYVVLDYEALPAGPGKQTALAAVEKAVRDASRTMCAPDGRRFVKSVHIDFHEPSLATVPVDIASVEKAPGPLDRLNRKLYVSSVAAALGISAATANAQEAASDRAVSGVNGEFAIMGGELDGDGAFLAEGAAAHPLGDRFGARWDAAVGAVDGEFLGGGAVHMFWRDPSTGLAGLAAGYLRSDVGSGDPADIGVVAGEGDIYFDKLTISGLAGYQFADDTGDDGFVGRLDLELYPNDDFLVTVGIESNPTHDVLGRFGAEYRPGVEALPGLSLFAEGAIGDEGYHRAFGGIRFYFGQSTTLKDRHRHDTFRSNILPTRMVDAIDTGPAYGD